MVQVSASGGLPPLTFSEGFGAYGTSGLFTNMSPGNHIMHIKDLNGCVVDTVVFISSPGQLSLNNLTLTAATCGLNNGAIQVISYGGVSPLQYALNSNPYNLTGLFSNLNPGVYTLHIKDANNCHRDSILNVPSISLLSLSAPTITQPLCFGGAGNVVINATGGSTPYTYSLD